jgi:hypothetical protein
VLIPLVLGKKSDAAQAPAESVERLLNAYLESAPTGKEPTPIYGTPGLTAWASGLDGATRGMLEMGETTYTVNGNRLYSFTSAGAPTSLGVIPNSDTVSMAGDGTNVVATTLGAIYVWNSGSGLVLVTDPDAPLAGSVAWSDGYFIFQELNSDLTPTQTYFLSALSDPINYDALDFASAEANPDTLTAVFVHHRILYLPGKRTIEAAQNTGGSDFPFTRYESVNIDVGLAGRDAICHTNDAIFLQAHDHTIRRIDGLSATKISTARITRLIRSWSDQTATVASAHVDADHLFVVFRNPDGCVVWDQNTERWHERASYGSDTWQVRHMVECYGLRLFGSATEGKIFSLDNDAYDEAGAILPFEIVTPFAYYQNQLLTIGELEVVAQAGVGSLTLDPQLTCERTKDGVTWSARKQRGLGKTGERQKRLRFGPQGQARAMAFRLRITDPVQRAVLGAYVEADT